MKFTTPDSTDRRIVYAAEKLMEDGFEKTEKRSEADFILLGVNPHKTLLKEDILTFAGNVSGDNVRDYTKAEEYAQYNAFLTAEAAVALAVINSDISLIQSRIMICGFGRIAKALLHYLRDYTPSITVCARDPVQLQLASALGAEAVFLSDLSKYKEQDFIFNTVPHLIFDYQTLNGLSVDAHLIDLASFPGGVDEHAARVLGIHLTAAKGLPGKYSPKSAGYAVAGAVEEMLKEGFT